jgi:nucleotide-binding universal stress UspA family protein
VFRSVVLIVDAACIECVIARAMQLPLAAGAALTLVELYGDAGRRSSLLAPRMRRVSVHVLDGRQLRHLVRDAELVVVGDIRLLGWHPGLLLGTAPTLFVRTSRIERYQRPVVAIGSCGAEQVLDITKTVLSTKRSSMTVVHASKRVAAHARWFVTNLLASLGGFGAGWTRHLGHGDPRALISQVAHDARADLVIMGCRPRTTLARILFGSVSRGVLRDVKCDVLTVPT